VSAAAQVVHAESWTITIRPGDGDTWPDRPVEHSSVVGKKYRPELITARLDREAKRPGVSLRGRVVKRDGTPGQVPADERFYYRDSQVPPWVLAEIRAAREANGLTPEATGVPWGWEL